MDDAAAVYNSGNDVGGRIMAQMIIASRLVDGIVVFLGNGGTWVDSIEAGHVVDAAEAERLMAVAKADEDRCIVVDPYVIDVDVSDGKRRPASVREAIRAFGPTIRTDAQMHSRE